MGLMDFIKGELIEIIEWTDDSRDTLSFRFPDDDKAIKNGAQLIVRESQQVQFVYLGEFGDTFGPGKHTLTTDNIPILTKLKSWRYGFNSPFKADVYFLNTRLFTGNKWGTANPIMMRDNDLGIVRVRAFGTYDFRIVDPKLFLKEVAGSDHNFRLDEFADTMRSRVVSIFADALASAHVPVFDVALSAVWDLPHVFLAVRWGSGGSQSHRPPPMMSTASGPRQRGTGAVILPLSRGER